MVPFCKKRYKRQSLNVSLQIDNLEHNNLQQNTIVRLFNTFINCYNSRITINKCGISFKQCKNILNVIFLLYFIAVGYFNSLSSRSMEFLGLTVLDFQSGSLAYYHKGMWELMMRGSLLPTHSLNTCTHAHPLIHTGLINTRASMKPVTANKKGKYYNT